MQDTQQKISELLKKAEEEQSSSDKQPGSPDPSQGIIKLIFYYLVH